METVNQVSYSLRDRYFSLEKEKRIGKRQFQTRVVVPGLLSLPIIAVFQAILLPIVMVATKDIMLIGIVGGIIPMFLLYGISLFFFPTLIKKRCHDFGSLGIIESRLFIGGFIAFMVVVLVFFGEIYFSSEVISLDVLLQIRQFLNYGIIILGLYLMLRPGTKGKNGYGDDTSNVKIGLLG